MNSVPFCFSLYFHSSYYSLNNWLASSTISDAASGNTIRSAKSGLGVFIIPVPFLIRETSDHTQKHISLRFLHKASAIIIVTSTKKSTLFLQKIYKPSFTRSFCHHLSCSGCGGASGRAVCTSTASVPMVSISCHGMVRLSSRPSNPNSLGRPSRIRLCSRAVAGSKVRSSARPRQTPCSSCTTSFSHSSRMVNALLPFLPQLMQPQKAVETAWQIVVYCGQSIP